MENVTLSYILNELKVRLIDFCMTSGFKLIGAIIVLVIGFKAVNIFSKRMQKTKLYARLEPTARTFFKSLTVIVLKTLVAVTAAIMVGVPMASLIAVIGSAGLAIGLALQGSLSNIAGGFIILVFKPFKVGDFIITADASGNVEGINLFYTKIVTVDNKVVMVPNAIISNQSLTDVTTKKERRVDLTFNTSYKCNVEEVRNLLLEQAVKHPLTLKTPDPESRLSEHGVNSLTFILRVWCKTDDYWKVYFDLMESVKKVFDEKGIEIPYQQLDVHIDNKND